MPFGEALQLERIPGTKYFKLIRPYVYYWPRKNKTIIVPTGYKTDQASIPRVILPIIVDNTGKITDAAVPHDYGYTDLSKQGWTKEDVDLMFRDAMIEAEMKKWRAYIAWAGVRSNIIAANRWPK